MEEVTPGPNVGQPTYSCTFGIYNQVTQWTDVRSLSWSELSNLLTHHEVGQNSRLIGGVVGRG